MTDEAATAQTLLKTLVEIRVARREKFVPYDLDRKLKRTEKDTWNLAEQLFGVAEPIKAKAPQPKALKPNKPKAA